MNNQDLNNNNNIEMPIVDNNGENLNSVRVTNSNESADSDYEIEYVDPIQPAGNGGDEVLSNASRQLNARFRTKRYNVGYDGQDIMSNASLHYDHSHHLRDLQNLNNAKRNSQVGFGLSASSNLNNDTNAARVAMGSSFNSNLINATCAYQQNMRYGFNMQPGGAYHQIMRNVTNVQPKGTTGVVANKTNFCKNNSEFLSFSVNNDIDVLQRYGILDMVQTHNGTNTASYSNGPSMPHTQNGTNVATDSNGTSVPQTHHRTNVATDSNGTSVPDTQNGTNVATDSNGPSMPDTQIGTNVATDSNGPSMPDTQNGTNVAPGRNSGRSNPQQSAYYQKYYPHPITGRLITSDEMIMFENELDYIKNNYGTVPSMQWFDKWKMSSSKETFDKLGIDSNIDLESAKLLGWKTKSCPNTSRAHFETLPYCGPYHDKEGKIKYVDYRPKNNVSVNSNTGGFGFPFPVIQDGGGVFQFGLGNFGGTMMTCQ